MSTCVGHGQIFSNTAREANVTRLSYTGISFHTLECLFAGMQQVLCKQSPDAENLPSLVNLFGFRGNFRGENITNLATDDAYLKFMITIELRKSFYLKPCLQPDIVLIVQNLAQRQLSFPRNPQRPA